MLEANEETIEFLLDEGSFVLKVSYFFPARSAHVEWGSNTIVQGDKSGQVYGLG